MEGARRLRTPRGRRAGIGTVAAVSLAYVIVVDPHRATGVRPRCPVKAVTGLDCPACGGMRMAYDVVHGDARGAIHDNAFLLACSPLLAALLWRSALTDDRAPVPRAPAYALGAGALAWMALRNVPRWPLKPTLRR